MPSSNGELNFGYGYIREVAYAAGGGTQGVEELSRISKTPKKLELLCSSKIYFTFFEF